jgi:hypothetical protein
MIQSHKLWTISTVAGIVDAEPALIKLGNDFYLQARLAGLLMPCQILAQENCAAVIPVSHTSARPNERTTCHTGDVARFYDGVGEVHYPIRMP